MCTKLVLAAFVALGLLTVGAGPAWALPVAVRVVPHDCVLPRGVLVEARQNLAVSSQLGKEPSRWRVPPGGALSIEIPKGVWTVSAVAEGLWSTAVTSEFPTAGPHLTLHVWPTASLQGTASIEGGVAAPGELEAAFSPAPRTKPKASEEDAAEEPRGAVRCPLVDLTWTCVVPAAVLDVNFHAKGFAAHYYWDVALRRDQQKLFGPLRLRPVASLVGFVRKPSGAAGGAAVQLVGRDGKPLESGPPSGVSRRFSTLTNQRGFYQLVEVPPGDHTAAVSLPGFADARVDVPIMPRTETSVLPLRLDRPEPLEVVVSPPVHPSGQPWSIELVGPAGDAGGFRVFADAFVPRDGHYRNAGLTPGAYELTLKAVGRRWLSRHIEVTRPTDPISLDIALARLTGTITLGGAPLQATLTFGGAYGAESLAFESNEDGEFEGLFLDDTDREWSLEVEASNPRVSRNLQHVKLEREAGGDLHLRLRLPGTTLKGQVLTEAGPPAKTALVTYQALRPAEQTITERADETGHFEMKGLPLGQAHVSARSPEGFAVGQQLELDDQKEAEVTLVLATTRTVDGVVVTPEGEGVAGATLTVIPVGIPVWTTVPTRTDAEGRFKVKIPHDTQELALTAGAFGFAFQYMRVTVAGTDPIRVPLDRFGGTLRLEVAFDLRAPWDTPRAYLASRGAWVPVSYLRSWAALNAAGEDSTGGDILILRNMGPGSYALCMATIPDSVRLGLVPPPLPCQGGYLPVGGDVTLHAPGSK